MKPYKFLLSALLVAGLAALVFYGCKKDAHKGPTVTSDASGNVTIAPYTGLTFNPVPGAVGLPFTATASLDPAVLCGSLWIDQAQYIADSPDGGLTYKANDPAPYEATLTNPALAAWQHFAGAQSNVPAGLPVSGTYVPQATGSVGFREHYDPGNKAEGCGAAANGGFNGQPSIGIDAVIGNATCTAGLFPDGVLSATEVPNTTDKKGTTFDFKIQFTINSCGAGIYGKLQGGLIAGAIIIPAGTTLGYSNPNSSQSSVISWSNVTDGVYTVEYTAHVLSVPFPGTAITGAWSYKWDVTKYGGTGIYGYTSPILFTY